MMNKLTRVTKQKGRKINVDTEFLKYLYDRGLTDQDIAKIFNVHITTVRRWRIKRLGLRLQEGRVKMSEDELNKLKILNKLGFNDKEIAIILGRDYNTIRKWRKRLGLEAVGYTCCSVLSSYIKRGYGEVIKDIISGLSDTEIMNKHKIKPTTLLKIKQAISCAQITMEILDKIMRGEEI